MARISIDGGKTFTTVEQAATRVMFDAMIRQADSRILNKVQSEMPGCSVFDLMHRYLEVAEKDLIFDVGN